MSCSLIAKEDFVWDQWVSSLTISHFLEQSVVLSTYKTLQGGDSQCLYLPDRVGERWMTKTVGVT